jgi:hypothetical protein
MQEQAAICEICGDTIYIEVEGQVGREREYSVNWQSEFSKAVERAAAAHIATHPTPVVERFLLRKHLDEIAPDVRPAAVKQVYAELREMWGDSDTRGMYPIDDVLGSTTVYRLWIDAERCTWERCKHDN